MDDAPDRPASRGWYLVSFGLIGIAIAIGLTGWNQMREVVATLQRHPMPGSAEVALAGGRATIYYEHESVFDDKEYRTPKDLAFTCTMANLNGKPHPMTASAGTTTYSADGIAGRNIYDLEVSAPGTYTLTCDAAQPFVIAVGGGMGAWFIVAIAGASFPGLAGLLVIVIVTLKRRRWHARKLEE